MSTSGGGEGSYGQNQQSFTYNDGNTQVSYSSQQYSWSSLQQSTAAQSPMSIPLPQMHSQPMARMLQMPDINQIHQQQMDLHRAHVQSAMQFQQNAMNSMRQPVQFHQPAIGRQPQIEYAHSPYPQPQVHYASSLPPQPVLASVQPLHIGATAEEFEPGFIAAERDEQILGFAQEIKDHMQRNEQQSQERADAQARKKLVKEAQDEQRREEQHELMNKLENLNSQISELRESQAAIPQPVSSVFDMEALQKVIREGQPDKISKDELKQFIDDAVAKRLDGVARTSDLELAASRFQRSIKKVAGASDAQVQETVKKELTDAINRVGRHMPVQQQKKVEAPHQQMSKPGSPLPRRFSTHLTVEELPGEDEESERTQRLSSRREPKSLTATDLRGDNVRGRGSKSQKRAAILPASGMEQQHHTASSSDPSAHLSPLSAAIKEPNGEETAMVRVKHSPDRRIRSSELPAISIQSSQQNAIPRRDGEGTQIFDIQPNRSSKMSTISVQPCAGSALVKPKAENAQKSEVDPNGSSVKSTMSEQTSGKNTLTQQSGSDIGYSQDHYNSPIKSSKMSPMSVYLSEPTALVRYGSDEALKHHHKHSRSAKRSTISVQPTQSNAMVRSGTGNRQQHTSSAEAMEAAQAQRIQLSLNNASERSGWQGREEPKQFVTKGSTTGSRRPRNDHRGDELVPSLLTPHDGVQEQYGDSTALVKQGKDVSKKSGR